MSDISHLTRARGGTEDRGHQLVRLLQALYLKGICCVQDCRQFLRTDVNNAMIYKLHNRLEVFKINIFKNNNRVLEK